MSVPSFSSQFNKALEYAVNAHQGQERKGRDAPYIGHPLGVASIVIGAGGTEAEAIEALLHDVVEDQPLPKGGGEGRLDDVRAGFGRDIASVVEALSDWISSEGGQGKDETDYEERKEAYRQRLRAERNPAVFLVSAADKLDNARSMEDDFDIIKEQLWTRFRGTPDQILRNYEELIKIYQAATVNDARLARIVAPLASTVARLRAKAGLASVNG